MPHDLSKTAEIFLVSNHVEGVSRMLIYDGRNFSTDVAY